MSIRTLEHMQGLRKELDRIIVSYNCSDQPREVEKLRLSYPHSIEVATDQRVDGIAPDVYNCFMYALGIAQSKLVQAIHDAFRNETRVDNKFVEFLLNNYAQQIVGKERPSDGDVLIYLDKTGIVQHAGVSTNESRVKSKWGKGRLWVHAPHEIPKSYGSTIRAYSKTNPPVIEQAFVTYAKERESASLIDEILCAYGARPEEAG